MNLRNKKRLAAETFGVGKSRILFVNERIEEIKEAITKQDMRNLHKDGAILIKEIRGRSKNVNKDKKRHVGKVRRKVNIRKREYVILTRKLRKVLAEKRNRGEISREEIKKLKSSKKDYEVDGIILTPADGKYNDMLVYKYKPLNKLSIDFLIKKCPAKLLGIKPYVSNGKTLYLLFCSINKYVYGRLNMQVIKHYDDIFSNINSRYLPEYFPIQFEPSDKQYAYLYWDSNDSSSNLDGQVGEFIYVNDKWKLIKIRDDRKIEVDRGNYFGNNYRFAEATWWSYKNPLVIEDDKVPDGYFQINESEMHKASRNFNRYVITNIFEQYSNTDWAMDMASGKGQDLFRYAKNNIGKNGGVLFLEIDTVALMELISRKHDFSNDRGNRNSHGNTHNESIRIYAHQMDLTQPYKTNISVLDEEKLQLPISGFDLIMCNFAFHYIIKTHSSIMSIIKFINHYLKPGGRFVFTAFDGESIVNLLKENKGEWNSKMPNKFSIKKMYHGDALLPDGQKIKVLLPFSNGEYYEEHLINISYLESEFAKYNLLLETNQSFGEFIDDYNNKANLDEDDIQYVSLYHYYSFYKSVKQLTSKKTSNRSNSKSTKVINEPNKEHNKEHNKELIVEPMDEPMDEPLYEA